MVRVETPACILIIAIAFSAWLFGGRPYWVALPLAALLISGSTLWLGGNLLRERLPTMSPLCICVLVLLGLQAIVSLLNPCSEFDVQRGAFLPNPSYVPFLPGTVDVRTGWSFTVEMLAYLGVIPVAAELSRLSRWRGRFVGAMALTGVSISLAGLCLRMGLAPRLNGYLAGRPWAQGNVFGPFDYHGNAGAFLNLVLPFIAARASAAATPGRRAAWWTALGIGYVALFVNGSRAALVIGLLLSSVCLWIAWAGHPASPASGRPGRWSVWKLASCAVLVAAAVAGVATAGRGSRGLHRLGHLSVELSDPAYPRYLQSRAAWEMAQERPLFGSGVGTYKVLVQTSSIRRYWFAPSFRPGEPFTVLGHTHEDYLQTLVEWGWCGFCGWSVLVGGAFFALWRTLRETGFRDRTALAVGVSLAGVYLHALGDCPLQIPAIQFYVALCLGMAWGSGRWQNEAQAAAAAGTIRTQPANG